MAHHVFRRPALTDSPYADTLALNPLLFASLRYASTTADGQLLYEDESRTDATEVSGDPIGSVVGLSDQVLELAQDTDADRPTFQGAGSLADFDSTDYLVSSTGNTPDAATELDFFHKTKTFTIIARCNFDVDDGNRTDTIVSVSDGSGGRAGPYLLRESRNAVGVENALRFLLADGDGNVIVNDTSSSDVLLAGNQYDIWVTGDGSTFRGGVDNTEIFNSSFLAGTATESITNALGLGAVVSLSGTPSRELDGQLGELFIDDSFYTQAEIQDIIEGWPS
jgi:hypothetical protein